MIYTLKIKNKVITNSSIYIARVILLKIDLKIYKMRVQYHYFSLVFIVLASFVLLASKPVTSSNNQNQSVISANLVYGDYSKFTFIVKNTSNKNAKIEDIKVGNDGSTYSLSFDIMDIDSKIKYRYIPKKSQARLIVNFVNSKQLKENCPELIDKVYIRMKIGEETIVMTSYKILICDSDNSNKVIANSK